MKKIRFLAIPLLLLLLSGCSSRQSFYEIIYNGLQNREALVRPSEEPVPPQQPSYEAYQQERDKNLNKDDAERR